MFFGLHVKYLQFLSDFNETRIFSTDWRKMLKYQILWKSVQWELFSSMRTGGRTDMTKLIVAFLIFVKASKSQYFYQRTQHVASNFFSFNTYILNNKRNHTHARPNIKEMVSLYEIVGCNLTLNKWSLISPSKSQPAQLQDNGSKEHINHLPLFKVQARSSEK
jgi:hypothetical protein